MYARMHAFSCAAGPEGIGHHVPLTYHMHACSCTRRAALLILGDIPPEDPCIPPITCGHTLKYTPRVYAAALRASGAMPQPHQAHGLISGLHEQAMTRDSGSLAPLLGFSAAAGGSQQHSY